MTPITLENLAVRLEAVEKQLADRRTSEPNGLKKDWRRTVGMFSGSEFIRQLDVECEAIRETERSEARVGAGE